MDQQGEAIAGWAGVTSLISQFRGEFAAVGAAFIWAVASVIYVGLGKQMPPLVLNFTKSTIAIGLILLTLGLQGDFPALDPYSLSLLLLSGAIGIGLGDTAFFASLNTIGARRTLLLEALAPPLTALLAALFLQEQLGLTACLGIALTVSGVAWVVIERTSEENQAYAHPLRGIVFGLMAALAQASGSVLSRSALMASEISPLWSALTRLVGGVVILSMLLLGQPRLWQGFVPLRSARFWLILTVASFAGTYLGIWLQQTALKYTQAGIAQSLIAISPLFAIPLAIALGERVSLRAILGVVIALIGVWLLFDFA